MSFNVCNFFFAVQLIYRICWINIFSQFIIENMKNAIKNSCNIIKANQIFLQSICEFAANSTDKKKNCLIFIIIGIKEKGVKGY